MPYVILDKVPIFISHSLEERLNKTILKDKDPVWLTSSMIQGFPEAKEKQSLFYSELLKQFRSNPSSFLREWSFINMKNDDARDNIWTILYDYCDLHGNSYLADIQDSQKQILWNCMEDSINLPMGGTFTLNATIAPKQAWWKFWTRKPVLKVSILINASTVHRIKGNLLSLKIYTKHFTIYCDDHIRIEPPQYTDDETC